MDGPRSVDRCRHRVAAALAMLMPCLDARDRDRWCAHCHGGRGRGRGRGFESREDLQIPHSEHHDHHQQPDEPQCLLSCSFVLPLHDRALSFCVCRTRDSIDEQRLDQVLGKEQVRAAESNEANESIEHREALACHSKLAAAFSLVARRAGWRSCQPRGSRHSSS